MAVNAKRIYNGVRFDSQVEAEHAARLDKWKEAGSVKEWTRDVPRITLVGANKKVLRTRTGKPCTYKPDFIVRFADGTVETQETKGGRWATSPDFGRWWIIHEVVKAMGHDIVLIGPDGQRIEVGS